MNRYLIYISYIGTHFKAFTKTKANGEIITPTTIGVLEDAMQRLRTKNPINVRTISVFIYLNFFRTDAGVHAINSAVFVDLERSNSEPYDCNYITSKLNQALEETPHQIRVNGAQRVPNTFNQHINGVKSRTYLYRLGVIKKNRNIDYTIDEKYRCYFMHSDEFDIDRFKQAAQMIQGMHDFRTFMTINNDAHLRASFAVRKMNYVKVERAQALTVKPIEHEENVDYWNLTFNAQSFLYRQIRRIVGTLVTFAQGNISQRDLYEMLTIPSQNSFKRKITVAPAHGLYLANIEFRERCLTEEIYENHHCMKKCQ
ncbi:tRNA pseudouridine synthase-like 1 isoform X2 [Contarinia nasturtii]|uniref:tRNA pseudouridine synthase-like 1 isoform X2 n=1 Tax=Contarinia nasturtii TaxID=265458 RepID=UPI0012D402EC|nr:tRNA pseudouridine synthase-like 1 isoform X2 [Contarinia nasturtii]